MDIVSLGGQTIIFLLAVNNPAKVHTQETQCPLIWQLSWIPTSETIPSMLFISWTSCLFTLVPTYSCLCLVTRHPPTMPHHCVYCGREIKRHLRGRPATVEQLQHASALWYTSPSPSANHGTNTRSRLLPWFIPFILRNNSNHKTTTGGWDTLHSSTTTTPAIYWVIVILTLNTNNGIHVVIVLCHNDNYQHLPWWWRIHPNPIYIKAGTSIWLCS